MGYGVLVRVISLALYVAMFYCEQRRLVRPLQQLSSVMKTNATNEHIKKQRHYPSKIFEKKRKNIYDVHNITNNIYNNVQCTITISTYLCTYLLPMIR